MKFIKNKKLQIFGDGSLTTIKSFFKQLNKIKISNKDHTTFYLYKKKSNYTKNCTNSITFKTKYLKF